MYFFIELLKFPLIFFRKSIIAARRKSLKSKTKLRKKQNKVATKVLRNVIGNYSGNEEVAISNCVSNYFTILFPINCKNSVTLSALVAKM